MIIEGILIAVTVTLIGFGLVIGLGLGREQGRRDGYRRGFDEGVEFARRLRRQKRGKPLYAHLRLVRGGGSEASPEDESPPARRAEPRD